MSLLKRSAPGLTREYRQSNCQWPSSPYLTAPLMAVHTSRVRSNIRCTISLDLMFGAFCGSPLSKVAALLPYLAGGSYLSPVGSKQIASRMLRAREDGPPRTLGSWIVFLFVCFLFGFFCFGSFSFSFYSLSDFFLFLQILFLNNFCNTWWHFSNTH